MKFLRMLLPVIVLTCGAFAGKTKADLTMGAATKADSAKQCAICHYRWVYTFFVEHKSTPIAELEEELVVGTQEMCLSCHDGSVMDSRDRICNDPGHRVGNIPSNRVRIPENFPLDRNGTMKCSTCHTPHAIEQEETSTGSFFLRAPNENSSFCKQCHLTKTGGKEKGNHPTDISAQNIPQAVIDAGGKIGTEMPNQIICETCHSPHGGINNRFLVLTVEDPKTRSVLCEVCHTKNPAVTGESSHHQHSHPYDLTPGKIPKIPKSWSNGKPVVLGAGGELVCRTCHIPHAAADEAMLLSESNVKDSICIQCHGDHKNIAQSDHYLKIIDPDERNIKGQRASEVGPCSACHLVHHGRDRLMWARTSGTVSGKPGEYCITCHRSDGIAENYMTGEFSHPLDVPLPEGMRSADLPLFDEFGENPRGEIRCATCHNFHNPYPLIEKGKGKGAVRAQYLRVTDENVAGVCVQCHPQQGLVKGTDHDLSITAPEFKNILGMTAEKGGICSSCHMVHNAPQKKFLWSGKLGPARLEWWDRKHSNEGSIMPGLCTGCHSSGGVGGEKVPKHGLHPRDFLVPQKEVSAGSAVRPRKIHDEDFPLYSDDGERIDTGNIVCSTCHDPHLWSPSGNGPGPGKKTEGNAANSFLRPDLGSRFCARCHGNESIVMFQYFHRDLSRKNKDTSGLSK